MIAEHEQACRDKEFKSLKQREVSKQLEVSCGKRLRDVAPSTGVVQKYGERKAHGNNGKDADNYVHVCDGGHSGDGGEENDERRDDVFAQVSGDHGRENEVQDVAAAGELIAGNGSEGEQNGDDSQYASGLVVARLEQIGDGELGKLARTRRNEVDEEQSRPSAACLPQGSEAMLVCVLRAAEKGSGADPRGQQRKHQDVSGKRSPGHEIVSLCLDAAKLQDGNREQRDNDKAKNGREKVHVLPFNGVT